MPALPPGARPSDFFHMYLYAPPLLTDIQAALTVIGRRSAYVGDEIDLIDANLTRARLFYANLTYARLLHADLHDALLIDVDLTYAGLFHTDLSGANLSGANLTHSDLTFVNLAGANLSNANLSAANLSHADLTGASLDGQKQLDEACGSDAKLPTGLTLKPCPPQSSP
jgi:uncharacterized protein YjbI with pentapeptide repeats